MARIGITAMPVDNFEIWQRSNMTSVIRLFKDLQTEIVAEETRLTANMVEVYLPFYAGFHDDVLMDFDYFYAEGLKLEHEQAKIKKREEIKSQLLTVDYAILMARFKAVDETSTLEEVEAI